MASDEMIQQAVLQQAADAGRATDTTLAHLTFGEVVIPRELMEDSEVAGAIAQIFDAYGVNLAEFTVGDPANKINPETGYPEFFFKKLFKAVKKIVKKAAPIALPILGSMIPGVGPVAGAALGGAAGGAIGGKGIKGALTGAVLGGAGGYLSGGAGGILGKAGGTFGPATAGQVAAAGGSTSGALSSLASGSGIRGILSGGLKTLGSGASTGGLGSISSFVSPAASLYSGMQQQGATDEAKKAMLAAQGRAASAVNPYAEQGLQAQTQLTNNLAEGFNPGDLASDPGYQFRLNQGLDAQNKSLAAQGLGQSGAALKAAQEYGQGFAAQEYGNAYDRWLQQNSQLAGVGGQGYNAANVLAGNYANQGDINAAATLSSAERKNKTIAEILAGLGYR